MYEQAERARLADTARRAPGGPVAGVRGGRPRAPAEAPADESEASAAATPEEPPKLPPKSPPRAPPKSLPPSQQRPRPSRRSRSRSAADAPLLAAPWWWPARIIGCVIGLLLFGGDSDDARHAKPAADRPGPGNRGARASTLKPIARWLPRAAAPRASRGAAPDSRLVMSLSDLPPREEAYAVWLYNSICSTRALDRVVGSCST